MEPQAGTVAVGETPYPYAQNEADRAGAELVNPLQPTAGRPRARQVRLRERLHHLPRPEGRRRRPRHRPLPEAAEPDDAEGARLARRRSCSTARCAARTRCRATRGRSTPATRGRSSSTSGRCRRWSRSRPPPSVPAGRSAGGHAAAPMRADRLRREVAMSHAHSHTLPAVPGRLAPARLVQGLSAAAVARRRRGARAGRFSRGDADARLERVSHRRVLRARPRRLRRRLAGDALPGRRRLVGDDAPDSRSDDGVAGPRRRAGDGRGPRRALAVPLVAPGCRGAGRAPAAQGAVPEHDDVHRARRRRACCSGSCSARCSLGASRRQDREGGIGPTRTSRTALGGLPGRLRADAEHRQLLLPAVARSALVLDDVRGAGVHRHRADGDGVRGGGGRPPRDGRAR